MPTSMGTAANVTAAKPGVGGAISRAPLNTTLPTDATTALAAAFASLGYISEDGLTVTNELTVEDTTAWGGDIVLSNQTGKANRFKAMLIEAKNVDVLKAVHGDANVSGALSTGITVNVNSAEQAAASWVVDMVLRDGALKRIVIPNGKITAIEDVTYSDSAAVGYDITITAMPDSSGNTSYEYIKAASTT